MTHGPAIGAIDSGDLEDLVLDDLGIHFVVLLHGHENLVRIVVSHSLFSSAGNGVVVLSDSDFVEHLVACRDDIGHLGVRHRLVERLDGVELA